MITTSTQPSPEPRPEQVMLDIPHLGLKFHVHASTRDRLIWDNYRSEDPAQIDKIFEEFNGKTGSSRIFACISVAGRLLDPQREPRLSLLQLYKELPALIVRNPEHRNCIEIVASTLCGSAIGTRSSSHVGANRTELCTERTFVQLVILLAHRSDAQVEGGAKDFYNLLLKLFIAQAESGRDEFSEPLRESIVNYFISAVNTPGCREDLKVLMREIFGNWNELLQGGKDEQSRIFRGSQGLIEDEDDDLDKVTGAGELSDLSLNTKKRSEYLIKSNSVAEIVDPMVTQPAWSDPFGWFAGRFSDEAAIALHHQGLDIFFGILSDKERCNAAIVDALQTLSKIGWRTWEWDARAGCSSKACLKELDQLSLSLSLEGLVERLNQYFTCEDTTLSWERYITDGCTINEHGALSDLKRWSFFFLKSALEVGAVNQILMQAPIIPDTSVIADKDNQRGILICGEGGFNRYPQIGHLPGVALSPARPELGVVFDLEWAVGTCVLGHLDRMGVPHQTLVGLDGLELFSEFQQKGLINDDFQGFLFGTNSRLSEAHPPQLIVFFRKDEPDQELDRTNSVDPSRLLLVG